MYGWLWQKLPGGTGWKVAQAGVLGLAVLALLFLVVFPWASMHVPFLRVTVEDPTAPASGVIAPLPTLVGRLLG